MKKQFTKIALAASLALAIAFTFGCEEKSGGKAEDNQAGAAELTVEKAAEAATESAKAEDAPKPSDEKLLKLIPAGYSFHSEIHGDLNGDKTDDLVLLVTKEDDEKRRGIMVYFKEGDAYKLALENRQCLVPEWKWARWEVDIKVGKGNLYVKYGYPDYTFRFRNSVFELIGFDGYDRREEENGGLIETSTSINFLSKKMKVSICESNEAQETPGCTVSKETWKDITLEKLPGLADIDFDNFAVSDYYKENKK